MKPSNILEIECLSEDWCDKDVVLLYACFQLLKDFVEKEKDLIEQIDWQEKQETKNAKAEIEHLYNWWIKRCEQNDDLNSKQYEEDNQMLKRLIDVRKYLWT